jgi:beta-phosphoglucomutase
VRKKLIIIDLDGVITSTTDEHFSAWVLLFKKYFGIRLDSNLETYVKGVSRIKSLEILLEKSGIQVESQKIINKMAQEKNKIYRELISDFNETRLMPGVVRFLEYLRNKGLKIALGSASKNGTFLLDKLKIESFFDFIVDPSLLKSKPHPDIFLTAMNHFDLEPEECIGIEDAISGVEAIKKANMYAIGIGPEKLDRADWQIKDLSHMDYEKLEEIVEGAHD